MVDLQTRTVGVFEQHGVIARREAVRLRRMYDPRAEPDQKRMRRVDVAAFPGRQQ